jgi:hypothetical protein
MRLGNYPPAFAPFQIVEAHSKAVLADLAWNFAMRLTGDDAEEAEKLIRSEGERVRWERTQRERARRIAEAK